MIGAGNGSSVGVVRAVVVGLSGGDRRKTSGSDKGVSQAGGGKVGEGWAKGATEAENAGSGRVLKVGSNSKFRSTLFCEEGLSRANRAIFLGTCECGILGEGS